MGLEILMRALRDRLHRHKWVYSWRGRYLELEPWQADARMCHCGIRQEREYEDNWTLFWNWKTVSTMPRARVGR